MSESGESSVVGGVIARAGTGLLSIFRFGVFRAGCSELLLSSISGSARTRFLSCDCVLSNFCRSAMALTIPAARVLPTALR